MGVAGHIADTVELNNGVKMPWFGLGVFKMSDEEVHGAVLAALKAGYRSIDTAAAYQNEAAVGAAIRASGVPREDIFLTTKLWNEDQKARRALEAMDESLTRLGTDYVDLYLIHWPWAETYVETWSALETIYAAGKARAIGLSNYHSHHIDALLATASVVPAVDQIEFHPNLVQSQLRSYCDGKGIRVEAWSPLMRGECADEPTICTLAEQHQRTPAQIVLRWNLQHGVVTIPKSVREERIIENAGIFDFVLSEQDMAALDALDQGRRFGADPDLLGFR